MTMSTSTRTVLAVGGIALVLLISLTFVSAFGAQDPHWGMMGPGMMAPGMMGPGMMGGAAGSVPSDPRSAPAVTTVAVTIRDFAFTPAHITVAPGATVTWTNKDSVAHTVTSTGQGEMSSPLLGAGESFSHTFRAPGTYAYSCGPHPWMTGAVTVE